MVQRDKAASEYSEIVHVEHAAMLCLPDLLQGAVVGHGGIVHPSVEPSKLACRNLGDLIGGIFIGDVDRAGGDLAALAANLLGDPIESLAIAGREDDGRAALNRGGGGGEADTACSTGDDDDLLRDGLQIVTHDEPPRVQRMAR